MIDLTTAHQLGNSMGIDSFSVVREFVQITFLNEFYAIPSSGKTIFKGGTALRLLFGSNRFSEDLDFTTDLEKKDLDEITSRTVGGMRKKVPNIAIRDLETIAGVSKKLVVQTEMIAQPLTIKLDFSQRERVFFVKQGVIKTSLPVSSTVLISFMDPTEILAEKVRAIMTREKGRDIYDMWYLLSKGVKFDSKLIQKKLMYYNEKYDRNKLIKKITAWNSREMDQDIRKFLPQKDRVVINKLKELLLEAVNQSL